MNLIFQYHIYDKDHYSGHVKYSVESFKKYADQYNHKHFFTEELFSTTHPVAPSGIRNKFEPYLYFEISRLWMDPVFDKYDQILYVDTDVIAHERAPDIFFVNPTHIAGATEMQLSDKNCIGMPGYDDPRWPENLETLEIAFKQADAPFVDTKYRFRDPSGIVRNNTKTRILNSGVLLWSKKARLFARENFMDWRKWIEIQSSNPITNVPWILLDQIYLAAQINKYKLDVVELDWKWNTGPHWWKDRIIPPSFFYHFSGKEQKQIIDFDYYK